MRPLIGIPCQSSLRSADRRFYVSQSYCTALYKAGGAPILIPLLDDHEALLDIYARLDGLLLAGGGDIEPHLFGHPRLARPRSVDPPRDRAELLLTSRAVSDDLPVLAICRGLQVLAVALGGTLYQDIQTQIPRALQHDFHPDHPRTTPRHEVRIKPRTQLAKIVGTLRLEVNSFHHQSIKDVPAVLKVAARAPDGVIEAVEAKSKRFAIGVQWHPEDLIDEDPRMRRLFETFVKEASKSPLRCTNRRLASY